MTALEEEVEGTQLDHCHYPRHKASSLLTVDSSPRCFGAGSVNHVVDNASSDPSFTRVAFPVFDLIDHIHNQTR